MRINRPVSLFLALALLASVVVGFSTTASAAPSPKAVGYWTQERLDSAQPIELVVDQKTGIGKLQVSPQAGKPSTRPPGNSTTTIATTDWPQGAPIAQTAVGKVFFTVGTSDYVCSGALVTDDRPDRAIVLTAAHCVWSQGSRGSFVTNWKFIPDYDDGNREGWESSALIVTKEFASQTKFNTTALANDWAFAVLLPNEKENPDNLPDVDFQGVEVNSYTLDINGFTAGSTSFAFGYPAKNPFDGLELKYAGATIFVDSSTSTTWGMNSTMTGGASGGPWISGLTDGVTINASGRLSSVNSYKYNLDSSKMYGPFFNPKTNTTFNTAKSVTTDRKV